MDAIHIDLIESNDQDAELIKKELSNRYQKKLIRRFNCVSDFKTHFLENDTNIIISDHFFNDGTFFDIVDHTKEHNVNVPIIVLSSTLSHIEIFELIIHNKINDIILKKDLHRLNQSIAKEIHTSKIITELKEQQQQLRLHSLASIHTHNGIIVTDQTGRTIWVNASYCQISGDTFENAIGKKPDELLHEVNINPAIRHRIREILKSQSSFTEEISITRTNGTENWIKLDIAPIYEDNEHKGFVATVEEITERKKIEAQIKSSEEQFRSLTENLPGVITQFIREKDGSGSIKYISEHCFDIYGLTKKEVLEDNLKLWNCIDLNDVAEIIHRMDISAKEMSHLNYQFGVTSITGVKRWLRVSSTPRKDEKTDQIIWDALIFDVTNEVITEKQLVTNEALFRSLTENLPGIVIRYISKENNNGTIEYISEQCQDICEISQKEILRDNTKLWKLINPKDAKVIVKSIAESTDKLSKWSFQFQIKTPSKINKWLRASGTPRLHTENDQLIWDILVLDVTKEIEVENALIDSNKRLIDAQKAGKIGDWNYDLKNDSITWSDECYKIYERKKHAGVPDYSQIVFGYIIGDATKFHNLVQKAIYQGVPYELEFRIKTEKGNYKDIIAIGLPVKDKHGDIIALYGTVQDITKKMNALRKIQDSEDRLEAAVHGADLGIWDLDVRSGNNIVNSRWYEMLGYKIGEIEPTYDSFIEMLHPHDKDIPEEGFKKINAGEKEFDGTIRLKHKDGNYRVIRNRARVFERDEEGNVVRLIGTHHDITNETLLQKKLKSSLNEKTILLQEIHHRVKNNLAIIIGFLYLQSYKTDSTKVSSFYNEMSNRIKSIADVHELLYSSETLSKINLKTYIEKLFNNVLSVTNGDILPSHSIHIENDFEININQAIPLGLLINELLTNSMKHAFLDIKKPTVSFTVFKNQNSVNIIHKDNGVGYDIEKQTSPSSLGFTLINTLLEQLESEYKFTNEFGFGIDFTFQLNEKGSHSYLTN